MDNTNCSIAVTTKKYHVEQGKRLPKLMSLECPKCGWHRLIDSRCGTTSRTYMPGQLGYEDADYFQKCCKCGEEIGIKKL